MHPQRPHLASPQTRHLAPPPFPAPPALKRTRPDTPPFAPTTPQATLQADGASAELLDTHEIMERTTKKPRLRNAEARLRQQAKQAARRATKAIDEQTDLGA
jgi:hypothetical protein